MDEYSFNIRVPKKWARMGMTVLVTALIVAPLTAIASHSFTDVPDSNTFHEDIAAIADAGVTFGCNPPTNDEYCPNDNVTRGQMAAFMNRLGALGPGKTPVANAATALEAEHATTADTASPTGPAGGVLSGSYPNPGLAANEAFREIGTAGEPAFQGAWSNFGAGRTSAGFFKDHQDIVHLKGSIDGGAAGTVAFTLPEGYRPNATLLAAAGSGNNTSTQVTIASNGQVTVFCDGGCAGSVGLDGISFRVGIGGAVVPPEPTTGETADG